MRTIDVRPAGFLAPRRGVAGRLGIVVAAVAGLSLAAHAALPRAPAAEPAPDVAPAPADQPAPRPSDVPRLVSAERIWDAAPHNAFTDLARWRDRWYCVLREGEAHVFGRDGCVRVLVSDDGRSWRSAALLSRPGVDLRDPKLSVTPDGRLMLLCGGAVYDGRARRGFRSRVAFSDDGARWTPLEPVLDEGQWLWRVTWRDDQAYGVAYSVSLEPREGAKPEPWQLTLVRGRDGLHYERVAALDVPGCPNEATVRFLDDQRMVMLLRRECGNARGWIGISRPPYRQWEWRETDMRLGGPNFVVLPDNACWAASRLYRAAIAEPDKPGMRTVLARMTTEGIEPVLELPSGGDTSYAGMVLHEGMLWVSYYSSHEGRAGIYLAKIRFDQPEPSPEEVPPP